MRNMTLPIQMYFLCPLGIPIAVAFRCRIRTARTPEQKRTKPSTPASKNECKNEHARENTCNTEHSREQKRVEKRAFQRKHEIDVSHAFTHIRKYSSVFIHIRTHARVSQFRLPKATGMLTRASLGASLWKCSYL